MLKRLWSNEPDPVWRTSLSAATGSWFEHLQRITASLGPIDREELAKVLGHEPSDDEISSLAHRVQGSETEWQRHEGVLEASLAIITDGGSGAALALKFRARQALEDDDRVSAIALFRAAILQNPTDAELHFRLGCSLWQVGEANSALAELELAIQLDPQWDRPRVEIAIVLLNKRQEESALAKLLKAKEELSSASHWLLLHLAYAHERLNHVLEAIEAYEALLELNPNHAEALDRAAHLNFIANNRRRGAAQAKLADHFGISTVHNAWQRGHYDAPTNNQRPPHRGSGNLLQFPD